MWVCCPVCIAIILKLVFHRITDCLCVGGLHKAYTALLRAQRAWISNVSNMNTSFAPCQRCFKFFVCRKLYITLVNFVTPACSDQYVRFNE